MEVLSPMKLQSISRPPSRSMVLMALFCARSCSATYIHQKAVTVFLRREDATTGFRVRIEGDEERAPVITVGSNLGGNPSLRRHGTAISFWCEMCGLTSTLAFAQHKGETFVSWQEIGRQPDNVRR